MARERRVAARGVERAAVRDAEEPRRGVVGDAAEGPRAQRLEQRLLHEVLRAVEVRGAEPPRERGDEAPRLMAEEVRDEPGHVAGRPAPARKAVGDAIGGAAPAG